MDMTTPVAEADLDPVLRLLTEADIQFAVVCSGPERTCPEWRVAQAA